MAWRDSRRNPSRLFLFLASVILGIAALVSIYSVGDNLSTQIEDQAATLLGADQEWITNRPFLDEENAKADSLAEEISEEWSFASMISFPKNQGTRLTQIRALKGNFPYYGQLETNPENARTELDNGQKALVDQTLLLQFGIDVGDSIKVGDVTFEIAGALLQAPGQTGIVATVAPVVYIPLAYLEETGLNQKGSRINYRLFLRLKEPAESNKIVETLSESFPHNDIQIRTIDDQKASTGRMFSNLTNFLGLAGFVALLLGCIGVASSVHLYIKEKFNTIAILRCLGVSSWQAFLIFLIQIASIGFIGSVLGALLGTILQSWLPLLVADFIPFELETSLSISAITQGVLLGVCVSLLFSLSSLLSIRRIAPLNVFRVNAKDNRGDNDPLRGLVYGVILVFVILFSYFQLKDWRTALIFSGGVIVSFMLLAGLASLLIRGIKKYFPSHWGFVARQGLANLYRPNNQTLTMIVALGLGTMLIGTLIIARNVLINEITATGNTDGNRPNMILFDIQDHQLDELKEHVATAGLKTLQSVPIVNMRLENVNGYNYAKAREDTTENIRSRLFSREYRVTYRDSLSSSEKLTAGQWIGTYHPGDGLVPVSMEEGFARRNGLNLKDTLIFNVQGMLVRTQLASLREVDWRGMQTNFVLIFPKGVLENAPKFHVLTTYLPTLEQSASFQQYLVRQFPNISIVDLNLILTTLDNVAEKIGFVIRFMALFSMLSGLIVLLGAVISSKYQRVRESVLLRTLGASRKQILWINGLEYFYLGALSSLIGIGLAIIAGALLAKFSFESELVVEIVPLLTVFLGITTITVLIGLFNSREVVTQSPLEVLRQEVG